MARHHPALTAVALVLLWLPVAAPAQQAPVEKSPAEQLPTEQVAGRVLSQLDKHPIPHARVTLTNLRNEKLAATTFADSEGHFRFDPVPSGKYRMTGSATNYISSSYLQHGAYSTAIVTGAGLATDSLDLELHPAASISGHVTDAGEPVPHASVTLFREDPASSKGVTRSSVTQTNEDGEYELNRVAPGRYFLVATGIPWYAVHAPADPPNFQPPFRAAVDPALDVAYPPVFYPHALDSSGASAITLQGGEEMIIDMQMVAEPAVTLTLQPAPGNNANNRPGVQLFFSLFGTDEPVFMQGGYTNSDGVTTIAGIAPGQYTLREFTNGSLFGSSRPIDLAASVTASDVANPSENASITVTARMANGASLPPQLQVNLQSLPMNQGPNGKVNEKGVAEFPNVPIGDYRLALVGSSRPTNILSLMVDGKPVVGKQLHIAKAAHLSVEMTLAQGALQVEGFVRRGGQPVAGAFVALVPSGADTSADLFRRDQTDLDGSFVFNNVVPGNYIAIALDDPAADLRWTDVPTITPYLLHGTPVSISAGVSSPVHLADSIAVQPR